MHNSLHVKELSELELESLMDYWYTADADYLKGMGADIVKLPPRADFTNTIARQIQLPYPKKKAFALVWYDGDQAIGHTNVNDISFGESAFMHLHLWYPSNRKKGMGSTLVRKSIPFFFEKLQLQTLYCEPYALNPAPNKTLPKIGFEFVKTYRTIPSSITFEQDVNQWKMTRPQFELLKLN